MTIDIWAAEPKGNIIKEERIARSRNDQQNTALEIKPPITTAYLRLVIAIVGVQSSPMLTLS